MPNTFGINFVLICQGPHLGHHPTIITRKRLTK